MASPIDYHSGGVSPDDLEAVVAVLRAAPSTDYTTIPHEAKSGAKCPSVFESKDDWCTTFERWISKQGMENEWGCENAARQAWQAAWNARSPLPVKVPLEKCMDAVKNYNANTHDCNAILFAEGLIKAVLTCVKEQAAKAGVQMEVGE